MVIVFFVSFFLIVQIFGLYLGNGYLNLINTGQAEPAFSNPENIGNSLFLFGYIIAATIAIIIIVRYVKFFIRIVEVVAVFAGTFLTFYILFPQNILVDFVLALILNVWRIMRPSGLLQNLSLALVIPSIGALIGTSLGVIPSLLFIVLLSIYDFISVFITKHMIYMAKEITKRPSAFALSMPYKFKKLKTIVSGKRELKKKLHVFQLGSGDMVIPLMFAVSVLSTYGFIQALITVIGSAVSFFFMLYFFTKKPRPLPAIPIICAGTLAGFLISVLLI